jgi:hypothetical protein
LSRIAGQWCLWSVQSGHSETCAHLLAGYAYSREGLVQDSINGGFSS